MSKGKEVVVEIAAAAESSNNDKKMLLLKSSDGEEFLLEESVAATGSGLIKGMLEDDCCTDDGVTVHAVTGPVLAKVIEYWKHHATSGDGDESSAEMKRWDGEFTKVGKGMMFDLVNAASYLEAQPLLDLFCQAVADTIKDMVVEAVRHYFGTEGDFSPEEEEELRKENS